MTKVHAMQKLLEHGPLNIRELLEITGWERDQVWHVLWPLMNRDIVTVANINGKRCYRLGGMYS